ncbi:2'-5' RNA ligase family protein [Streptomyces sp. NBC_00388]|uniref:2'-5' RNA ligase family protein n=1 Tax=Streptomyces sp. NBC_00388 TaxID=2975735 RepID=UPI002E207795
MYQAGDTALVITVPEAEPVVAGWRARFDPMAADGIPAHLTVLYPFLPQDRIDDGVLDALARLFSGHPAFDVTFRECGRFPGLLHLAPEPDGPVRALTRAVYARWPEAPPYGGRFGDPAPHVTLTQRQDPAVLDMVEADVRKRLPFGAAVRSVGLVAYDGTAWSSRAGFPLGSAPAPEEGGQGAT